MKIIMDVVTYLVAALMFFGVSIANNFDNKNNQQANLNSVPLAVLISIDSIDDSISTIYYSDIEPVERLEITPQPDGVVTPKIVTDVAKIEGLDPSNNRVDTLHRKEWFGYKDTELKYDWEPLNWTDKQVILFANILYRESGYTQGIHNEIDVYLVAIAAIRRHLDIGTKIITILKYNKKKYKNRFKKKAFREDDEYHYVKKFLGGYSMEPYTIPDFNKSTTPKRMEKEWRACYKIAENVLNCTIPSYVPYVPHGTFAYLNSRLDTDTKWINSCTTKWCVVASTVKDHHYYADPRYMTKEEERILRNNPINSCNKRFKDGLFARQYKQNTEL